ncbi:hypothetical protein ACVW19_006689 [Streptomyces sp. TE5632]
MAAPADEQDKATVSVLHGIPGMTVDVYANGDELLDDFKPGTVTGPQALDAGTYDIQIFEAGQGPDGAPALQKEIKVPEGSNATVAAHLTADGEPRLTAFVNDVSQVGAGGAHLTVRHVTAAPAWVPLPTGAGAHRVRDAGGRSDPRRARAPGGTGLGQRCSARRRQRVPGPARPSRRPVAHRRRSPCLVPPFRWG